MEADETKTGPVRRGASTRPHRLMVPNPETATRPHFMIGDDLYLPALEQARRDRVSVSAVVNYGLRRFTRGSRPGDKTGRPRKELPVKVAAALRRLAASDPGRLNAYLRALSDAGYTLAAIGAVLGVSRQAVDQRIRQGPRDMPDGLPAVPTSPLREAVTAVANRPKTERSDRGLILEGDVYEATKVKANRLGLRVLDVVEYVLAEYVLGRLPLPEDTRKDPL